MHGEKVPECDLVGAWVPSRGWLELKLAQSAVLNLESPGVGALGW
jgi:hypothetical protein